MLTATVHSLVFFLFKCHLLKILKILEYFQLLRTCPEWLGPHLFFRQHLLWAWVNFSELSLTVADATRRCGPPSTASAWQPLSSFRNLNSLPQRSVYLFNFSLLVYRLLSLPVNCLTHLQFPFRTCLLFPYGQGLPVQSRVATDWQRACFSFPRRRTNWCTTCGFHLDLDVIYVFLNILWILGR